MGENLKERLNEAWHDTQKRHNLCFLAFILIIAIGIIGFFGIKRIVRGENLIHGSWEYVADIASYGDSNYTMNLTSDYRYYLISEYATNNGSYKITNGGKQGAFYTDIMGAKTYYTYRLSDDGNSLFLTARGSIEHELKRTVIE